MPEPALAVAVEYDPLSGHLPFVTAVGRGLVAERIRAIAEAHGVPVRANADLARLLAGVELGAPVPMAAFAALAEIIAALMRADRGLRETALASGAPGQPAP
jgi:flagellar biosynthesis protein